MSKFFLYADPESQAILSEDSEKLILLGSDFAYGNFGDILQHTNSLEFAKKNKRYRTISIFAAEAISSPEFPQWARQHYGTDAIIFVSAVPYFFRDAAPNVDLVTKIRGISGIWMYGGGFLNAFWGEFVLGVVEYFLDRFPNVPYWISGQQITPPFQSRVCEHAQHYKPQLFGVRDIESYKSMRTVGYEPRFSFDDATEALQKLGVETLKRSNQGVFAHFNVSDYTSNSDTSSALSNELKALQPYVSSGEDLTIFQAFRDRRENVKDAREAIKWLETDFPFSDYRFIELAALCYPSLKNTLGRPLSGAFGYSCSYHVALWLQLSGVPCYLRSRNTFYNQKANALGVSQTYQEFLEEPKLTNHGENLERREEWLSSLSHALDTIPAIKAGALFNWAKENDKAWQYYFKGTPTLEEKLEWQTNHAANLSNELTLQRDHAESIERELSAIKGENTEPHGRLEALSAQLTEVGNDAHQQRERVEVAERELGAFKSENVELRDQLETVSAQLSAVFASRSWRLTRGLRVLGRLFRGEFGLVWASIQQRFQRDK